MRGQVVYCTARVCDHNSDGVCAAKEVHMRKANMAVTCGEFRVSRDYDEIMRLLGGNVRCSNQKEGEDGLY